MSHDTLFLQKQYADQLASRLPMFTKKKESPYLANFRCDICGDSATRKHVKRGFIITSDKGSLIYYCQNCGASLPLPVYLEQHHGDLFKRYLLDVFGNKKVERTESSVDLMTRRSYEPSYQGLTPIQDLPLSHPAIQYLMDRRLPASKCRRLFYADKFYKYINNIIPDKFPKWMEERKEHGRIIIPLLTKEGEMFGVIGRALSDETLRYITIKFDEQYPKIYGLDQVDFDKHIYVLEGAFDSMFIDNAIALAGTDADITKILPNKSKHTIVLDNQPRNREVVGKYRKYVYDDFNIVIWPDELAMKGKDVNQYIKAGYTPDEIKKIISKHTYRGQMAAVMFNKWRKVDDRSSR